MSKSACRDIFAWSQKIPVHRNFFRKATWWQNENIICFHLRNQGDDKMLACLFLSPGVMHIFLIWCSDELVSPHYPALVLLPALADALLPHQWSLFKIWIPWMNESPYYICLSFLLLSCSPHPIQFSLYFPDTRENMSMQSPVVNGARWNLSSFNFSFPNSESVKHFLKYPLDISIFFWGLSTQTFGPFLDCMIQFLVVAVL